MYAKLFAQMYDGSLCTRGPWEALVTFQQLLVLADQEGTVDMTAEAIARRTTIPIEIITKGIAKLLLPDPQSRTPTCEGRRILPLSDERNWGWRVVNYEQYRKLKREADRRDYHREYWHKRKLNTPQHTQQNQPIAEAEAEAKEDSEAKASGAKAPAKLTPEEIIFAYGVPLLCSAGSSEKQARSFLGGLRKGHGDDAVVDALRECLRAKPLQPLEWLAAALKPKPAGKQTAIESRNAAVVARLIKEASSATK